MTLNIACGRYYTDYFEWNRKSKVQYFRSMSFDFENGRVGKGTDGDGTFVPAIGCCVIYYFIFSEHFAYVRDFEMDISDHFPLEQIELFQGIILARPWIRFKWGTDGDQFLLRLSY